MKGSPKGDFFRYRAKYGLTDALSRAGMTGPDPNRIAQTNICAEKFFNKFEKSY